MESLQLSFLHVGFLNKRLALGLFELFFVPIEARGEEAGQLGDEGMPEGVRPLVSLPQEVQAEHLLRVEQDGSLWWGGVGEGADKVALEQGS